MTTEHERTKGIVKTRKFLQILASPVDVIIRSLVRSVAERLLGRHPLNVDLEAFVSALPGVLARPPPGCAWHRELSPTAQRCFLRCAKTATHRFPHRRDVAKQIHKT
jgi:hypothetical protein